MISTLVVYEDARVVLTTLTNFYVFYLIERATLHPDSSRVLFGFEASWNELAS